MLSYTWWLGYFDDTALSRVFAALSVFSVTSAANERDFSIRGNIHTKRRNRLAVETVTKIGFINHNLRILSNETPSMKRVEAESDGEDYTVFDDAIFE
uniref:HAT C-terminal dimerisation domain-containing protein n=1 Tax=Acrobeloides nanus TaxID=290746 RepID=A0A914EIU0_9BILA